MPITGIGACRSSLPRSTSRSDRGTARTETNLLQRLIYSRRTRNIEEQEGHFRHPGHVWLDGGFDDMSGIKRRRF